ncbi:hypothetical protein HPB47_027457 [Ixodes persulcatus]|uniref:Uncharacterized protein n=1 Tax=Ixodes persulcatus TaxID=34615 RepID=A0AC60PW40_IXOPE|nr:hypothetical protein HPB47_027457 [Ixodes persulcatus]
MKQATTDVRGGDDRDVDSGDGPVTWSGLRHRIQPSTATSPRCGVDRILGTDTRLQEAGAKVVCCLARGAPKGPNLPRARLNHQDALFPGHGLATHSQTWPGARQYLFLKAPCAAEVRLHLIGINYARTPQRLPHLWLRIARARNLRPSWDGARSYIRWPSGPRHGPTILAPQNTSSSFWEGSARRHNWEPALAQLGPVSPNSFEA